mmetsp:Transcript_20526/g.25374  ORF Transcript_20526/g.25374 Transcript_20526/m.25374 type:complete len:261 (+) Transcript_20526:568-1350(+)
MRNNPVPADITSLDFATSITGTTIVITVSVGGGATTNTTRRVARRRVIGTRHEGIFLLALSDRIVLLPVIDEQLHLLTPVKDQVGIEHVMQTPVLVMNVRHVVPVGGFTPAPFVTKRQQPPLRVVRQRTRIVGSNVKHAILRNHLSEQFLFRGRGRHFVSVLDPAFHSRRRRVQNDARFRRSFITPIGRRLLKKKVLHFHRDAALDIGGAKGTVPTQIAKRGRFPPRRRRRRGGTTTVVAAVVPVVVAARDIVVDRTLEC